VRTALAAAGTCGRAGSAVTQGPRAPLKRRPVSASNITADSHPHGSRPAASTPHPGTRNLTPTVSFVTKRQLSKRFPRRIHVHFLSPPTRATHPAHLTLPYITVPTPPCPANNANGLRPPYSLTSSRVLCLQILFIFCPNRRRTRFAY
jgi:hypothetical protein